MARQVHMPVMPNEVFDLLDPRPGATIVDATVGAAGHSRPIADAIGSEGTLVVLDQDPEILEHARQNLTDFTGRLEVVHSNFEKLGDVLYELEIEAVDGILMDLGASSLQFDTAERGFSFMADGPLDMRMNPKSPRTARRALNKFSEKDIAGILFEYGQERFARRIARAIVKQRTRAPFNTTSQLVDVIKSVIHGGRQKIHPATRTFMALRIWVNRELECLEGAMQDVEHYLRPGGRLAVIAFHSLEDRIVKFALREKDKNGSMKILTKKPLTASDEEVEANPRSRSAKLRAAERTQEALE